MPNIVLDLTRLFSRRGKTADTGIDRVERGIFNAIKDDPQHRYVIRYGKFYFLLDNKGAQIAISGPKSGRAASLARLYHLSLARGFRLLSLKGFDEFWHFGHIAHGEEFWQTLKKSGLKITLMVHDVIPLDNPEFLRDPSEETSFRKAKLELWAKYADRILCPSQFSADRLAHHAPNAKNIDVTPLAIEFIPPNTKGAPKDAYLTIGTIEPRKNHALLLKIWERLYEEFGEASPHLWIVGARGWNNDEVFKFLDHSPLMGKTVFDLGAIDDEALEKRFTQARAILFPTHTEGFGIPLYEAILAKKPIIANKIPVFAENLTPNSVKTLLPISKVDDWYDKIAYRQEQHLELKNQLLHNWSSYLELHLLVMPSQ